MKIVVSNTVKSKRWKSRDVSWSDFVKRLKSPIKVPYSRTEFLAKSQEQQAKIKDVGGYTAGEFIGERRVNSELKNRIMVTLDIDFAKSVDALISDFQLCFPDTACVIHGTIKHTDEAPRLRLIAPISRTVTPLEYEAMARKFAEYFDIELFDKTTFESSRMMFWPTHFADTEPLLFEQEGEPLTPEDFLQQYGKALEWRDPKNWPRHSGEKEIRTVVNGALMADPWQKEGFEGIVCRAIRDAGGIDFLIGEGGILEGLYEQSREEGRYKYSESDSAPGVRVLEEGRFLDSHHESDPAHGVHNLYDVIRLHKEEQYLNKKDFDAYLRSLPFVLDADWKEWEEKEARDKEESGCEYKGEYEKLSKEEREKVFKKLDVIAKTKEAKCTVGNLHEILGLDPRFSGAIRKNIFAQLRVADSKKVSAWGVKLTSEEQESAKVQGGYVTFTDAHISAITRMIEHDYRMKVNDITLKKALHLIAHNNHIHPLREYLNAQPEWDGKPRLASTLHEAFKTEKDAYHAEVWTKVVVAAVARAYHPGIKFDNMMVLVGAQGVGKSTFVQRLTPPGSGWFTSSIDITKAGERESMEKLLGVWIVEVAELSNRKADQDKLKNYISSQSDRFRIPYESTPDTFKRQNIFIATTNNTEFLVDTTGSRRFWPIQIGSYSDVWELMTPDYVAQILAEAVSIYRKVSHNGLSIRALEEYLLLTELAEDTANYERLRHTDISEEQLTVNDYVNMRVPDSWSKMTVPEKREYFINYTADKLNLDHTKPLSITSPREVYEVAICADGRTVQTLGESDSRRLKRYIQAQGFIKPSKFKYIAADGTATGHKKDGRMRGYEKNV